MELLEFVSVSKHFSGVTALADFSMACPAGKISALIGPNGAGKTTALNVVSRLVRPDTGSVMFGDVDLLRLSRHRIATVGIARTFQNVALWPSMPVINNVMIGAHTCAQLGLVRYALRLGRAREERRVRGVAIEALKEVGCAHLAGAMPDDLPFATQKRIELARALAGEPRLLLLDEPANALPHAEVDALAELLREIQQNRALTMVLIDHHMGLVMSLADHVVVAEAGTVIAQGDPATVRADPRVVQAYLGTHAS